MAIDLTYDVHSAVYVSVPFCRTKCSFCNFASGVFSRDLFDRYIAHLERAIANAPTLAAELGATFDPVLDSIYLGGGTPSVLAPDQLDRLFAAISRVFVTTEKTEFTVEVAPGTLSDEVLAALLRARVNRVSLGVQSFVDQESRSVGRMHTRDIALRDIARLRHAGIDEISIDLIAGLPYQTSESWERSLDEVLSLAVPHVSVYMLEIDDDSRLGRELIAGGTRYHAHHVPGEELTIALYERACERLNGSGVLQYEISNFARPGHRSQHNLRYWRRLPYFGFGVDAHSMLPAPVASEPHRAIRIATPDSLDLLLADAPSERTTISTLQAVEEVYFLGLRMNCGIQLSAIAQQFGAAAVDFYRDVVADLVSRELLSLENGWLSLTARGRLLSNEVFTAFLRD
ncbi:MAG TPA: radical SAM family heme chaperone HemW [Candidatus Saccharimonadales bacterium]|nr:radical SAM family heme chaperone HemW [Candidatus Saccharimonadales bacterium]